MPGPGEDHVRGVVGSIGPGLGHSPDMWTVSSVFQAAAKLSARVSACFLGRLIPEILAIDLGGLDGQLLGGQVGRRRFLAARSGRSGVSPRVPEHAR